jgi:hypothetical protein
MQGPYSAPRLALKGYLGSQGLLHGIGCFRWLGIVLFVIRIITVSVVGEQVLNLHLILEV